VPGYPNATIYYTLDGTTPTSSSSTYLASSPLNITTRKTVTVFATQPNYLNSGFSATVIGDAHSPTARADIFQVQQDDPPAQLDVLANDDDPDDDPLTISGVVQPTHGTVTFTAGTPSLAYQPATGFFGIDAFSYSISDGNGNAATATATVFVNKQGNHAPTVAPANTTIGVGATSAGVDLRAGATDPDNDIVSIYSVSQPTVGNATIDPGDGSATYIRPGGAFVSLTVACFVTDAVGGFGETSASVANLDSDSDGIPDEWELAHAMDPADPSDAAADLDNDGLPNLAEYLLQTDPGHADNPLSLSLPSTGSVSGELRILIPVSAALDQTSGSFALLLDGDAAEEASVERDSDGTWWAVLDTMTIPNGVHDIRLRYAYPQPWQHPNLSPVRGPATTITVANPVTLDQLTSEFASTIYIRGQLNISADAYQIDLSDEKGQHVKTLSGSLSGNALDVSWDLTGGDAPVTGDLQAFIVLTDAQAPGQQHTANAHFRMGPGRVGDNYFLVAGDTYMYDAAKDKKRQFDGLTESVVNRISNPGDDSYALLPLGKSAWDCCTYHLDVGDRNDVKRFLRNLRSADNVFYWGHGSGDSLGGLSGNLTTRGTVDHGIATILGFWPDPKTHQKLSKHYIRLAFIDGCGAYTKEMCNAFGVPFSPVNADPSGHGSTYRCADFERAGLAPRAFVAWDEKTEAPADGSYFWVWDRYWRAYQIMFDMWMSGDTITQCMVEYSNRMRFDLYFIEAAENWAISGCWDLRRLDQ
jgi:hypothetical protein